VFEHEGLYVYRRDVLITLAGLAPTTLEQVESLEQLRVLEHGYKLRVVETRAHDHEFTGFSVDTAEDVERAEVRGVPGVGPVAATSLPPQLDGASAPAVLLDRAVALGMPALANTDHDPVSRGVTTFRSWGGMAR
jgi:hypothetical protein